MLKTYGGSLCSCGIACSFERWETNFASEIVYIFSLIGNFSCKYIQMFITINKYKLNNSMPLWIFKYYLRPKPVFQLLSGGVLVYFLVQEGFLTAMVQQLGLYMEETIGRGEGQGAGVGRGWNSWHMIWPCVKILTEMLKNHKLPDG